MSDINWKDGAVCYINGRQRNHESIWINGVFDDEVGIDDFDDFQLNEITTGDFIPASELDTEQKYNEAVEVFGLFGFKVPRDKNYFSIKGCMVLKAFGDYILPDVSLTAGCKRQLTYSQIMAIGKLKRMMLEREVGKFNKEFNESEIESVLSEADKAYLIGEVDSFSDETLSTKSSKAYDLLDSIGYGYDINKQQWFHKVYV